MSSNPLTHHTPSGARGRTLLLALAVAFAMVAGLFAAGPADAQDRAIEPTLDTISGALDCETIVAGKRAATPSTDLVDYMERWSNPPWRDFGETGYDQIFGHTFTLDVPAGYSVVSGALTIDATQGGGNDTFMTGDFPNQPMSGQSLSDAGYSMNTAGSQTFNLSAAPRPGTTVDLLPNMTSSENLDVLVQDDTVVDRLQLTYCIERDGVECQTLVGQRPATPSNTLANYLDLWGNPPWRDFGQAGLDQLFGHSFALSVPTNYSVVSGELEIVATQGGSNDTLAIGGIGIPGELPGSETLTNAGFQMNTSVTKTYDLDDLPRLGTTVSVLEYMTASENLDVLVQDDTVVDHLEVTYCIAYTGPLCTTVVANRQATPSRDLVTYMDRWSNPPWRNFGQTGLDQIFGHTFTLNVPSGDSVVSGQLTINATQGGGNDTFMAGDFPNQPMSGQSLSDAGFSMNTAGSETFDLSAAPRGASVVNLLPNMTASQNLDVLVQDDTVVSQLTLTYCTHTVDGPVIGPASTKAKLRR